jgi:hypothetical protein
MSRCLVTGSAIAAIYALASTHRNQPTCFLLMLSTNYPSTARQLNCPSTARQLNLFPSLSPFARAHRTVSRTPFCSSSTLIVNEVKGRHLTSNPYARPTIIRTSPVEGDIVPRAESIPDRPSCGNCPRLHEVQRSPCSRQLQVRIEHLRNRKIATSNVRRHPTAQIPCSSQSHGGAALGTGFRPRLAICRGKPWHASTDPRLLQSGLIERIPGLRFEYWTSRFDSSTRGLVIE